MPIRLVTDSTCDVPPELIERHQIVVVPAILNLEEQSYRDVVDIARADFYRRLPALKTLPTTSAPAAGEFEAAYRQCGDADIISIHLASTLSGLFNSARVGAEAFGGRVTMMDSGQLSMGLGWQVLAAAEAIASGQSLAQVLQVIASVKRRVKIVAALDTIEYLRRSGRATFLTAALGQLLQIKPLLEVMDGEVMAVAKMRTHSKALEKLIELVAALKPIERLAVMHAASLDEARALADRLVTLGLSPEPHPLIVEVTPIIGTHVGPGTLAVAAVRAS